MVAVSEPRAVSAILTRFPLRMPAAAEAESRLYQNSAARNRPCRVAPMHSVDYETVTADERLETDLRKLVELGIAEDLAGQLDWTTAATVPADARGRCQIVPRCAGTAAGLVTVPWIIASLGGDLTFEPHLQDGTRFTPRQPLGSIEGNVRDLLTAERLILNIVSRMSGVATLTATYVEQIADTAARLYDTRKTTTGWRRLEKYAVHCGGGHNHRSGLYDGFLIKDNHLALAGSDGIPLSPAAAVRRARDLSTRNTASTLEGHRPPAIVEIEVDSLDQLREVLPERPDIVLVDNFAIPDLRQAVALRDALNPAVELEASGGVTLESLREIAQTGVDRISCGALTHQAVWLDLGLDWSRASITT